MDPADYHVLPPKRDTTTTDIMAPSPSCSSTGTQQPDDFVYNDSTGYASREATEYCDKMSQIRSVTMSRSTVRPAVDPIVQCPICYEAMVSPKMLTCLHNACKKCLHSYILSELRNDIQNDAFVDAFPCPVCRQCIKPPNPELGIVKWASQFPTNHFLHTYGMILSVQRELVECDPCQRRGERTLATWWCRECSEYQCNVCKTVHSGFKLFKHHNVIPVQDIAKNPDIAVPKYEPCSEHKEKITKFCRDHRTPCCGSCVITKHRKCDHVVTVQEEFASLNSKEEILRVSNTLQDYEEMTNDLTEFRKRLIENLEQRKYDIIGEIDKIRKEFVEGLDRLRDKLINDLEDFHATQLDDLQQLTVECENLGKQISNSKNLIETVQRSGSESHVISLMENIKRECFNYERDLLERQSKLQHVDYVFHVDPVIANAIRCAKSLGSINLERSQQSSQDIMHVNPVNRGPIREIGRIKVWLAGDRGHCNIVGGVFMEDGKIMVADSENFKLKLFTKEGRLVNLLKLKSKPSDLAMVNVNTFVVTYPSANKIQIVTLDNNSFHVDENQRIETNRMYTALSCNGESIYLCSKTGIAVCDSVCKEKAFLKSPEHGKQSFKAPSKIKASPHGLLITDQRDGKEGKDVLHTLSSTDGRLLRSFSADNFKGPVGVDVNSHGEVYVCCRKSANVHRLTPDGQGSTIVLSANDGIGQPYLIKFQKYSNKFFVSDMTLTNRDHLKIFTLT